MSEAKHQATSEDVQKGLRWFNMQLAESQTALLPHVVRLLAKGEPVTVHTLAGVTGMGVEQIEAQLDERLSVERDEAGRIVGWGLTLRPTPHTFAFDNRTVFGWCASDVLMFPVILGTSGVIQSTDPTTGQIIRVEVTPHHVLRVDPPAAVVTEVRPAARVADIRTDVCGLGYFVRSRAAAAHWLAAHPEGEVRSVADDFEIHRQIVTELGWAV